MLLFTSKIVTKQGHFSSWVNTCIKKFVNRAYILWQILQNQSLDKTDLTNKQLVMIDCLNDHFQNCIFGQDMVMWFIQAGLTPAFSNHRNITKKW